MGSGTRLSLSGRYMHSDVTDGTLGCGNAGLSQGLPLSQAVAREQYGVEHFGEFWQAAAEAERVAASLLGKLVRQYVKSVRKYVKSVLGEPGDRRYRGQGRVCWRWREGGWSGRRIGEAGAHSAPIKYASDVAQASHYLATTASAHHPA